MITVFKTVLKIEDEQKVEIQKGARILKCASQNDKITIWFMCDPEAELVEETFYVVGTGQQLPDTFPGLYVDTVGCEEFIWHVFFKQKPNVKRGKTIQRDPNDPGSKGTREEGGDNGA